MATNNVISENFGKTSEGKTVTSYSLKNKNGVFINILDLGGTITNIKVPDRSGSFADIVTGYPTLQEYEENACYFGCIVGRVANRIFEGKFSIDGKSYQLNVNRPPNHIHGGFIGFNKKIWEAKIESNRLHLSYVSLDGDEKYPGQLTTSVTYQLNDNNELDIDCRATSDQPTLVNLTNHSYFNLAGHAAGDVSDHVMSIVADAYLPKTKDGVPTGSIANVRDTLFDLRSPVKLGDRIPRVVEQVSGYDHNFCLKQTGQKTLAARCVHPPSGRVLEVYTDQPGIQLYTGNYLNGVKGKDGAVYNQHAALCLETQDYPDAIHHENFPSCILRPGQEYVHRTTFKFSVE